MPEIIIRSSRKLSPARMELLTGIGNRGFNGIGIGRWEALRNEIGYKLSTSPMDMDQLPLELEQTDQAIQFISNALNKQSILQPGESIEVRPSLLDGNNLSEKIKIEVARLLHSRRFSN